MLRTMLKVVGALVALLAVIGVVFVLGMRAKSPLVLNTIRRGNRAMRATALRTSGTIGSTTSTVRHTGRVSGAAYETPVQAVPTADGFVIALPYGLNTDWLNNVLAVGRAVIVHDGADHRVDHPQVVPMADAEQLFDAGDRRTHRLFHVDHALTVRHVAAN